MAALSPNLGLIPHSSHLASFARILKQNVDLYPIDDQPVALCRQLDVSAVEPINVPEATSVVLHCGQASLTKLSPTASPADLQQWCVPFTVATGASLTLTHCNIHCDTSSATQRPRDAVHAAAAPPGHHACGEATLASLLSVATGATLTIQHSSITCSASVRPPAPPAWLP